MIPHIVRETVFLYFAALTVAGAVLTVSLNRVLHNAIALAVTLFGIAGLYVFLGAEYLAVIQLIVYIGAIAIVIVFAIMLTDPAQTALRSGTRKTLASLIAAGAWVFLVGASVLNTPWSRQASPEVSVQELGTHLLGWAALPFEIVSLILLVTILGALLASGERNES
ncbi:MAG: NADH-quinone oxidoreductase subunit J [Candidatus Omnitrophica bacterium]|nr:NADH-quinone oxidoreductase subunit J [Candidatus Omnitrophota bacterium]